MTITSATAPLHDRVAAIVLLLSSSHDGEIVAAAHALQRTLHAAGRDLHYLAETIRGAGRPAPIGRPREDDRDDEDILDALLGQWKTHLSPYEREFVASVAQQYSRRGHLTERQSAVVRQIWYRVTKRAAA